MIQSNSFGGLNGVNLQIQNKRRKQQLNGMWGAPVEFFINQGINQTFNQVFNQNQINSGWGQQGVCQNNNNWGTSWQGSNNNEQNFSQLQMALFGNQNNWGNHLQGLDWVNQQQKRQQFQIIKANQKDNISPFANFGEILHKQITFLEPSPAIKRLQQLKRQGKQFYDDRFPPNNQSLCGQYGFVNQWRDIKWKKISQMIPNARIFKDRVQPSDIKQGYLGDCYFLAGLAALAQRPDRIFNLFLLKQMNSVKYYSVKMLYKGKWLTIDMDQYIPELNGKPAFSNAVDNQLWVVLLEKAWAKMYHSYKRIEAGYPQETLHDLTGAPIKQICPKQSGFNKQAQWQYLVMASEREYSMVASSQPGSDRNKSQKGIVLGHAYTFLNATVLNYNGGSQRIVQLRNPWGKGQYTGRWSDKDPNWRLVPQSQLQRIRYSNNPNDGIFFMSYDAFLSQFRNLTVAQINDNASYVYKSIKDRQIQGCFFKIQIFKNGYYSFQVDKTPQRSFEQRIQDIYQYPQAKLQLGCINGRTCKKIEIFSSSRRTLFRGYQLSPGVYVAYVKISFNPKFQKDFDVNLAVYSEYACDISIAPRDLAVIFTGNQNINWNPSQNQQSSNDWNYLGNTDYKKGDSGWGTYNNISNNNNNNGWGNNNGWDTNNNGWGNNNNNNTNTNNNNGWGDFNNNANNNNNGWGTTNNNGWGNNNTINNNNNGWSDTNNNGWGNNIGLGNTNINNLNSNTNNNNGWGNFFDNKNNTQNNSSWGNSFNDQSNKGGFNNGW